MSDKAAGADAGDFRAWMAEGRQQIEALLSELMAGYRGDVPDALCEAMAYSLLAGGKRLRPLLVMAAAEACSVEKGADGAALDVLSIPAVRDAAAAVEMIHTYSLIHDDLPSMDNDDMRRGQPTSHKKFGEALALLAGDALLTEAFAVVGGAHRAGTGENADDAAVRGKLCGLFARHAGARGMVGGQVDDTVSQREDTVEFLDRINLRKTGDLLALSCAAGACAVGAPDALIQRLAHVGFLMGLAFQQWDDVLDVEGDPLLMGKSTGNDAQQHKLTYPGLIGLDETRESARARVREAQEILSPMLPAAAHLRALAAAMVDRKN